MFHAEIRPAKTFKQIIESLKEVVTQVTFECSQTQMQVQAMDMSHISLVSLELTADQFHSYRCDKNLPLGVDVGALSKMMKCCNACDCVTLRAEPDGDELHIRLATPEEERVSDFTMKLMEIDTESLGIPPQEYKAGLQMPSAEFAKICRDIANFGDTVTLEVKPDFVSFSASNDMGTGKMILKASKNVDQNGFTDSIISNGEQVAVKKEKEEKEAVKMEKMEKDEEANGQAKKKRRQEKAPKLERAADVVRIECKEPVSLQFPLRYLTMFSKAQGVSDTVRMKLAAGIPLQVEFEITASQDAGDKEAGGKHKLGYLRYYLAPKVGDDAENEDEGQAGPAGTQDEDEVME